LNQPAYDKAVHARFGPVPDFNATLRLHGCAQHGFSHEQVVDTVLITCTFNFMGRLADGLGVELDPQMQRLVEQNADKGIGGRT
jgi:alkylhydroperoxidase family enzyme